MNSAVEVDLLEGDFWERAALLGAVVSLLRVLIAEARREKRPIRDRSTWRAGSLGSRAALLIEEAALAFAVRTVAGQRGDMPLFRYIRIPEAKHIDLEVDHSLEREDEKSPSDGSGAARVV